MFHIINCIIYSQRARPPRDPIARAAARNRAGNRRGERARLHVPARVYRTAAPRTYTAATCSGDVVASPAVV
jgi:hypothetical protein